MLITSLIAAATAAKLITTAKIMVTVGTAMVAISPAVEKMKEERS